MVPNQENMEFKAIVTHSSHCNHRLVSGALSWWNKTPLFSYPGHSQNVCSTPFQSPELPIKCGFIWRETMQLVSWKFEFNACQVSVQWHNSFLVSLWTFHSTLVCTSSLRTRMALFLDTNRHVYTAQKHRS